MRSLVGIALLPLLFVAACSSGPASSGDGGLPPSDASGSGGVVGTGGGPGGTGGSPGGTGGRPGGTGGAVAGCIAAGCGGDVVGTWTIDGICMYVPPSWWSSHFGGCPGADGTKSPAVSGSADLRSDGTYIMTQTSILTDRFTVPLSCTSEVSCADLQISQLAASGAQSVSCTGTTVCNCTVVHAQRQATVSGTYSISGTTITFLPSGSTPETDEFCVSGTTLTLQAPGGTEGRRSQMTLHR